MKLRKKTAIMHSESLDPLGREVKPDIIRKFEKTTGQQESFR